MADTHELLRRMTEYREALFRHLQKLRVDFEELEKTWYAFGAVYEGEAADQFKAGWDRTTSRFEEYMEYTHRILDVLDERIGALADADRAEDILS